MVTVALLVMTDGRTEYIHQTIESANQMLKGPIIERWMHDDSGDEGHRQWLRTNFPAFSLIGEGPRKGFGGAYAFAWRVLAARSSASFVFGLEDDFVFNREIPLEKMAKVLDENPHLYQMALRRQAWSSEEILAGGVIEKNPDAYLQQEGWISHKLFFTTNPNLYRKSLIETRQYATVKDAEGHFTHSILNSDPDAQFGYWGQKTDLPWVTHTGVRRKGSIY